MASAALGGALSHLRQALATIDKDKGFSLAAEELLPLGLPAVDAALGGGLACGALHELAPAAPAQFGTVLGFALMLAALRTGGGKGRKASAGKPSGSHSSGSKSSGGTSSALFIQTDFARARSRRALRPRPRSVSACRRSGCIVLRVPRPVDALFAMEEALKCRARRHRDRGVAGRRPPTSPRRGGCRSRRATAAGSASCCGIAPLPIAERRDDPLAGRGRAEPAATRFGGLGTHRLPLSLVNEPARPLRPLGSCAWDHHERAFLRGGISRCGCGGLPTDRLRGDRAEPRRLQPLAVVADR